MADSLTPNQLDYFTDDLEEWGVVDSHGDVTVRIDYQPDDTSTPCIAVLVAKDPKIAGFVTHLLAINTADGDHIADVTEAMSMLTGLQSISTDGTDTVIYWPTITA